MYRILIVDDERIERNGIRFLLKKLNMEFDIDEAVNGLDALEKMRQENYDILLTDVKMPFMDGIELIDNVVNEKKKKLDAMVNREVYSKSKTAPTEEEREKFRQEYLDRKGMQESFRWYGYLVVIYIRMKLLHIYILILFLM